MADFEAVLRKTVDGLREPTPELRQKVYQRARDTVEAKLAAIKPPPPEAARERQRKGLEEAIARIEAEFTPAAPADDGFDELENIFASLAEPLPPAGQAEPASKAASDARVPAALAPDPADAVEMKERAASAAEPSETISAIPPSPRPRRERQGGGITRFAIAAVLLIALAGGGYAVWLNRDDFSTLFAGSDPVPVEPAGEEPAAETAAELEEEAPAEQEQQAALPSEPEPEAETAPAPQPEPSAEAEPAPGAEEDAAGSPAAPAEEPAGPQKFTQRLNADGTEVDEGPAGQRPSLGEGTSVAELNTPAPAGPEPAQEEQAQAEEPAAPETPAAAEEDAALPVGQRAIFYEERTSSAQGSAESGTIVWSVVQESPGGDLPPEPAIRAEATIPGKDLQLRMTIRRNGDQTLPASHIVEMIFLAPDDFAGGGIENVLRLTLKDTEQATGNPLLGMPAKIADGFFLIALTDGPAEIEANTTLLRRQNWLDVPMVYRSGRRALITMEKGIPGERVFEEVLRAWQNASSG